jgi:hypothetical protein
MQTLCNLILVKNQVIKRDADTLGVIAYSLKSVICMEGVLQQRFMCGSAMRSLNDFRNWFVRCDLMFPLDSELAFGVEMSSAWN